MCKDTEQLKSWSQNLGHEGVLTTFSSFGTVAPHRQRQIIQSLAVGGRQPRADVEVMAQKRRPKAP